jgi:hypothetical protein
MSTTVGCLSRLYIGEIPYIRHFINHGLRVGIDTFYFVLPSTEHMDRIVEVLRPFRDHCELIVEQGGRNVNQSLKIDISLVKTDYLVSVDVDEFIYLDTTKRLGEYLRDSNLPTCNMKWIMSPRDFYPQVGPITGFMGHTGKRLAKTSLIQGIANPHAFETDSALRFRPDPAIHLVHYWGRSFEDILIKCVYQNLPNRKRSSLSEMQTLMKTRQLPERLRVLASLTRHEADVRLRHENHVLIDPDLEQELLAVCGGDFLADIAAVYREYKSALRYDAHIGSYPGIGNIYDLGRDILPKKTLKTLVAT